ncbi:MAG: hypothetical protein KF741_02825 [Ferruginibacter sp.]|nr:hypothetical protein [Bacteroidota bacterium]MBX2918155.1 hypothetical protein [Ferruginibacter sp.]MCB0708623.1 hypothetical protein [Chitinophagaceae bacterium]
MNNYLCKLWVTVLLCISACSNPTNKRAVGLDELENIQAEDKKQMEEVGPKRGMLTAVELIDLSNCADLSCIQLFMKPLSTDFVYGKKGEFYAAQNITIKDTSGTELTMPASTFYIDVNPQASWRAAHTVHLKEQGDSLLNEFKKLGFHLVDEGYYLGLKSKQQRWVSEKYPGKSLYVTATFKPWYFKGLYENKTTWPCYVFEVYNNQ